MASKKYSTCKIQIEKETKEKMVSDIKNYFLKERDEELGDLAANFILDFFLEDLAPHIYNQGVYDSYKYMGERTEDLLEIIKS
ncbi:hypothetical protein Desdi_0996 [Desulfitobacterium dichloroeliminans LMG P-21439]|uniref:DUF2164 domain-containing protein n=1 Tax=Desulfitobacterium dichloroeliminans (strain LMG P-21439 / DCA1) TaxID=871963 RepID=L0F672_DESDL|nr:DUF2164 domain-containing protein [Desulfitobacterium dichloroeliminans]AGA68515.1 hypothetical protein Desdi_0996 [Desulfitobacterium dichloroeliminans LMG P-21439]